MAESIDIDARAKQLLEETVLYEQQANVLARMEAGMGREEIAEELGLSEHTVRRHQENIEEKLRLVAGSVHHLDVPEHVAGSET